MKTWTCFHFGHSPTLPAPHFLSRSVKTRQYPRPEKMGFQAEPGQRSKLKEPNSVAKEWNGVQGKVDASVNYSIFCLVARV